MLISPLIFNILVLNKLDQLGYNYYCLFIYIEITYIYYQLTINLYIKNILFLTYYFTMGTHNYLIFNTYFIMFELFCFKFL